MSNKDAVINQISSIDIKALAELLSYLPSKCLQCSNYYWDGNQQKCHMNINRSSCSQGILEWLESNSDENLEVKYKKKYFGFKNHDYKMLGLQLISLLYSEGLVKNLNDNCKYCKKDECINHDHLDHTCSDCWYNLILMKQQYVREHASKIDPSNGWDAHQFEEKYRLLITYIEDVLVPKVSDFSIQKDIFNLIEQLKTMYNN